MNSKTPRIAQDRRTPKDLPRNLDPTKKQPHDQQISFYSDDILVDYTSKSENVVFYFKIAGDQ